MSRDMTLFVDNDNKGYHIYSSEDNLTLHIAELTEDYLDYTGKYVRIAPAGHNEAPAIFKKDGRYFMINNYIISQLKSHAWPTHFIPRYFTY
ncbi:hypothetical protein [Sphingobacterium gobiense]|uniref:hypothetical protein n=1 Tax=Sphingobacterium gobiense TaxID=1382456 RepID=UPI001C61400A|nr:hypothetical protein [Sphingobacterium gobiense]